MHYGENKAEKGDGEVVNRVIKEGLLERVFEQRLR